jgi:hypothetical protein
MAYFFGDIRRLGIDDAIGVAVDPEVAYKIMLDDEDDNRDWSP